MGYIAQSLAISTVVGVVLGLAIADGLQQNDAAATGLVLGGWCYFALTMWKVMRLGHFGRGNFLPFFHFFLPSHTSFRAASASQMGCIAELSYDDFWPEVDRNYLGRKLRRI